MEYVKYLKELRTKIIIVIVCFGIISGVMLYFSDEILKCVLAYGNSLVDIKYVYLYPQEIFVQQIVLAITIAMILALPILICACILFISNALYKKELVFLAICSVFAVVLFACGIFFSVKIIFPFCLKYFAGVNKQFDVESSVSVEKYLGLFKTMLLSLGFVFEMPIVSALLTFANLITPELLKKGRKAAIVLAFVIGAIITPPDIISQTFTAIPIVLLYELCILLSWVIVKVKHKRRPRECL